MPKPMNVLAAMLAMAAATAAVAQPGPPPNPGPATDPMNPYATPRGMEAGNSTADPTGRELLDRRVREAADERAGARSRNAVRGVAATLADLVAGSGVNDSRGKPVGTIESVGADGAVVTTASGGKVMVPLDAFGKNKKGLMLAVTQAEFEAAVAAATSAR